MNIHITHLYFQFNMTPQKAEYLRSQSFDNSDSSTPPQFVTPKLPGQKAHTRRDSSGNQNPNKVPLGFYNDLLLLIVFSLMIHKFYMR